MAVSEFLPFAVNAAANVMPQDAYEANPAVNNGYSAGIARSREANKTWRQGTLGVSALTWLIPDFLDEDARDDGNRPTLTDQLRRMIGAVSNSLSEFQNPPLDGVVYGRRHNEWVPVVQDAVSDGLTYGRRNGGWVRVPGWDELTNPATGFLPLAGGTMLGYITLHAWPSASMHAVPMSWVEAYVGGQIGGFLTDAPGGAWFVRTAGAWGNASGLFLPLTGGTLAGPGNLTVNGALNGTTITANDITATGTLRTQYMAPSSGTTVNMQFTLVAAAGNLGVANHLSVTNGICMGGAFNADYIVSMYPGADASFYRGIVADHFTLSSDERYKTNVTPTERDALAAIRPIKFFAFDRPFADPRTREMGRPPRHIDTGLLAQQVQQTLPEAVSEIAEVIGPVECDRARFFDPCEVQTRPALALDLMTLVTYTMRAVQQLADRVDAIEAKG